MHEHQVDFWQHSHAFARINRKGERRTVAVLVLTFLTMLVEIVAGMQFHSMALLADGWHMSTHVVAFLITLVAYRYTRRHTADATFAFSAAKVGLLGGFASSIALAMVALIMVLESVERLLLPQAIQFDEAIVVACVGLLINVVCALLLGGHDHDHHDHDHDHDHKHGHHHDHNLRAAYLHVMADALTSVLAIVALLAGKFYGWDWLDAVMGFVGALVILAWAWGLIAETSPVLLDHSIGHDGQQRIQTALEADGETRVTDLHVWRVGSGHYAAIIAVVSCQPQSPQYYKQLVAPLLRLDHVTVEVSCCVGEAACQRE